MRIPLAVDLAINKISGASYTELDSGIHNGYVNVEGGRPFVTQRPSLDWIEDASDTVADAQGRGIYYWQATGFRYFVNKNKIYKGDYSTVLATITAGTRRVYFYEIGVYLVVIDWENDEGWYITTGGTVTAITDTEFPPNATPAVSLSHGAAVVNDRLYVLGADGIVYNSAEGDPSAWAAADYIGASRDPDGGAYCGNHHDNVVAMGPSTIEFFYDNGNATGSPLNRRSDIFHTLGCADGGSVWEVGDRMFFVGTDESSGLGVYVLEQFQPRKVSTPAIDSICATAVNGDSYVMAGAGFTANGHTFYILSFLVEDTVLTPEISYVYDATTGKWFTWSTAFAGNSQFSIIQWATRRSTTARRGEGILVSGDIVALVDDLSPQDTTGLSGGYVADGFVEDGYVSGAGLTGTAYEMRIRVGQSDLGLRELKIFDELSVVADRAAASVSATVKWANENSATWTSGRTLDLAKERRLTSLGSAFRRNFEVSVTSSEVLRLESLDVRARAGR